MSVPIIVAISPVRCAVLAMFSIMPSLLDGALARWVGSAAYGYIEIQLI